MLAPLGTALTFALFILLTRALSTEPATATVFVSGLVGLMVALALEIVVPTTTSPTPIEWGAIGIVGLAALTGHRLLVAAYRRGRASDLAPLGYLSLLWSFAIGAIVFGEAVQPRAVLGAVAIAVGGLMALRGGPPAETVPKPSVPVDELVALDPGDLPGAPPRAAGSTG
jgi:S-adenosylmethionine uptake transporter